MLQFTIPLIIKDYYDIKLQSSPFYISKEHTLSLSVHISHTYSQLIRICSRLITFFRDFLTIFQIISSPIKILDPGMSTGIFEWLPQGCTLALVFLVNLQTLPIRITTRPTLGTFLFVGSRHCNFVTCFYDGRLLTVEEWSTYMG